MSWGGSTTLWCCSYQLPFTHSDHFKTFPLLEAASLPCPLLASLNSLKNKEPTGRIPSPSHCQTYNPVTSAPTWSSSCLYNRGAASLPPWGQFYLWSFGFFSPTLFQDFTLFVFCFLSYKFYLDHFHQYLKIFKSLPLKKKVPWPHVLLQVVPRLPPPDFFKRIDYSHGLHFITSIPSCTCCH